MFNDIVGTWLFDSLLTFLLFSFSVSLCFLHRESIVFCVRLWCGCGFASLRPLTLSRSLSHYHVANNISVVWCVCLRNSLAHSLHIACRLCYDRGRPRAHRIHTSFISLPFIRVHVWPHPIRFILYLLFTFTCLFMASLDRLFLLFSSILFFLLLLLLLFDSVSRSRRFLHLPAIYIASLCSLI